MKNPLKSLLITSALTLPTVQGATDHFSESTDSPNTTALTCVTADKQDAKRPKLTLAIMPNTNVATVITGEIDSTNFILGFLDVHALAALARTSTDLNNFAQPMLNAIRVWGQTNFIPRLLQGTSLNHADKQALAFFRIKADTWFNTLLNIVIAVKYWTASMTSAERTALVTAINTNTKITPDQKYILIKLLPNATLPDIRWAAEGLRKLRPKYHARAADLFERLANHPTATPPDIRWKAEELRGLGPIYHNRAADLFKKSATHQNATPPDIRWAELGLRALANAHPENSEERIRYTGMAECPT